MGKIDDAVAWAVDIANDPAHGYDQTNRTGPDYDCSSLVCSAWKIGAGLSEIPISSTHYMIPQFLSTGKFTEITNQVSFPNGAGLRKGDIVWKLGHVEMVCQTSPLKLVKASMNENGGIKGGEPGDQNGKEIRITNYYNSPWTRALRYTAPDAGGSGSSGGGGSGGSGSGGSTSNKRRYFLIIASSGMRMREEASLSASKILTIPKGEIISGTKLVSNQDLEWLYTTYNGKSGYVAVLPESKGYTTEVTEQYGETDSGGSGGDSGGPDGGGTGPDGGTGGDSGGDNTPPQWADEIVTFNRTAGGSGDSNDESYIEAYDNYHEEKYSGSDYARYVVAYNGTLDKEPCITSGKISSLLLEEPNGLVFHVGVSETRYQPIVSIREKIMSSQGLIEWKLIEKIDYEKQTSNSKEEIYSFRINKKYPENSFISIYFNDYIGEEEDFPIGNSLDLFIYSDNYELAKTFLDEEAQITSISFNRYSPRNAMHANKFIITGSRVTPIAGKSGLHFTSYTGENQNMISDLIWNSTSKEDLLSTYCYIRNCSYRDLVLRYAIQGLITDEKTLGRCTANDEKGINNGYGYYTVTIKPGETTNISYCVKNYAKKGEKPVAKIYNSSLPNNTQEIDFEKLFWYFDVMSSPANFIIINRDAKTGEFANIFPTNANFAIEAITLSTFK